MAQTQIAAAARIGVQHLGQCPDRQNRRERHQALAEHESGVDRMDRKNGQHGHRPDRDPAAISPAGETVERRQAQQIDDEAARLGRD